jgi:hypothetical protein
MQDRTNKLPGLLGARLTVPSQILLLLKGTEFAVLENLP